MHREDTLLHRHTGRFFLVVTAAEDKEMRINSVSDSKNVAETDTYIHDSVHNDYVDAII